MHRAYCLLIRLFNDNFFASECNSCLNHSAHTRAVHFRFILLFLNLIQRFLSQKLQILPMIPGGFQLKDKPRKLLIHRLQLDIEVSQSGFPICFFLYSLFFIAENW